MKYYLKKIGTLFLYLLLATITGILLAGLDGVSEENGITTWAIIKFVLSLLNLFVFYTSVVIMFFREGQSAYKQLGVNDIIRRQIVKTGKDMPIKREEEYRAWKGFVLPLFIFIPLVILLVVHLIVGLSTGYQTVTWGVASSFIYMGFYAPVFALVEASKILPTAHFVTLYAIPLTSAVAGVSYMLGARNRKQEEKMIEEKNRAIYGEKECE